MATATATVHTPPASKVAKPRVGEAFWAVAAYVWMFVSAIWLVAFVRMLGDAAPIIEMLEQEAGRELTIEEWYTHEGAGAYFDPSVDPGATRVGRTIDASLAGLALGVSTFIACFVAAALLIPKVARRTRHNRIVSAVVAGMFAVSTAIIVTNLDTLNILGSIID